MSRGDISLLLSRLDEAGCFPSEPRWIDENKAADIPFAEQPANAKVALERVIEGLDVIVQAEEGREKKLLISDMDSTMITIECIDELADYAGIKPQVAEVTERAMRGELDFEAALDARVALLKGLPIEKLDICRHERVKIMPGAFELVRTMRARGARTILVSGGFTVFADAVAKEIGFERAVSNVLGIQGTMLDGTVARPIVGAQSKRSILFEELEAHALPAEASMAVGDGANDIPMIEASGMGVAYHAKEKAAAAAAGRIIYGDLSALLYAQGIARKDWAIA